MSQNNIGLPEVPPEYSFSVHFLMKTLMGFAINHIRGKFTHSQRPKEKKSGFKVLEQQNFQTEK